MARDLWPELVNDPFGDPALYVGFRFSRRGLLFDLGDISTLHHRRIRGLTDVFVSHAHVDHFIGFDRILRRLLAHGGSLRLYGPCGIAERVEHKLGGYTWNLVDDMRIKIEFDVLEILGRETAQRTSFHLSDGFARSPIEPVKLRDGCLMEDDRIMVTTAVLDHKIPCLAFAVKEKLHLRVLKDRINELRLDVGPWLTTLKQAIRSGAPDSMLITVMARHTDGRRYEKDISVGSLSDNLIEESEGEKVAYVVDALFSPENAEKIIQLIDGADILFIEAACDRADHEVAAKNYHLTTEQAGYLARRAGVKCIRPFHFSMRYSGEAERLVNEVNMAFLGLDCY